jgi:hypothetical protein
MTHPSVVSLGTEITKERKGIKDLGQIADNKDVKVKPND